MSSSFPHHLEEEKSQMHLILGGTGKTGRRVATRLTQLGHRIRIGSRTGDPRFDWNDAETWAGALEGVRRAYVTYQPDLAVPGARECIQGFTSEAARAGVEKLVLLSGKGETEAEQCEEIVKSSGVAWTVVRASWFHQNFSESFFRDPIMAGHVSLPRAEALIPFVDADDIADVAVAALLGDEHSGQTYELTGPRQLTFRDATREISEATGRQIDFESVTMEAYEEMLRQFAVPEDYIWLIRYLFTHVLTPENSAITTDVRRVLGREPKDFTEFAQETAAAGIWADASSTEPARDGAVRSESNEEVMRRFINQVVNGADYDAVPTMVSPDYTHRSPGEELHGPDALVDLLRGYRSAFPDLKIDIDELLTAGESTVMSFTLTGTHRGELMGMPATGRCAEVRGMIRSKFRDGMIVDEWEILDQFSLLEQLGLAPVGV
ncbi:MAG: SnoaL-like domain-containing protein [Gemmatimonadetes bacterium]|nr:SnoaL-like domain-containing protein [Gemmatimonadota bacterium]